MKSDLRTRTRHYIVSVEKLEAPIRTVCIETDAPSHLFLAGKGMIPTHNSILRNAFTSWYEKKHIEQIEGIGIERDLAGLPVALVPSEMLDPKADADTIAAKESIVELVQNIRRDQQEGVLFPLDYHEIHPEPLFKLELLSTGGTRQFDTDKIISRKDQRITMTTMADFLTLGHERVGSNALAQEKGRLFIAAIGGWLSVISSVINDHAIRRLLLLNGYSTVDPPRFVHGEIERPDILMLGTYILNLAQAGMPLDYTPGGELMQYLMSAAHLPEPPDYATYPLGAGPLGVDPTDQKSGDYQSKPATPPATAPGTKPADAPKAKPSRPPPTKAKPMGAGLEAEAESDDATLSAHRLALNQYRENRAEAERLSRVAAEARRKRGHKPQGSFGRVPPIPKET